MHIEVRKWLTRLAILSPSSNANFPSSKGKDIIILIRHIKMKEVHMYTHLYCNKRKQFDLHLHQKIHSNLQELW